MNEDIVETSKDMGLVKVVPNVFGIRWNTLLLKLCKVVDQRVHETNYHRNEQVRGLISGPVNEYLVDVDGEEYEVSCMEGEPDVMNMFGVVLPLEINQVFQSFAWENQFLVSVNVNVATSLHQRFVSHCFQGW